jgi:hypothetical protein
MAQTKKERRLSRSPRCQEEKMYSPYMLYINLIDNWSVKAIRRNTQGTGRMSYLKKVYRRAKNGFREGTKAPSNKRRAEVKK